MIATMPQSRPLLMGPPPSFDSSSSRVSLRRFLKAFRAILSSCAVGTPLDEEPAGDITSPLGVRQFSEFDWVATGSRADSIVHFTAYHWCAPLANRRSLRSVWPAQNRIENVT